MPSLLTKLHLTDLNPGVCTGADGWINDPKGTPLVCEETFAPILYIMEYNEWEEAIALHNGVPQGLSSAIFTTNWPRASILANAQPWKRVSWRWVVYTGL